MDREKIITERASKIIVTPVKWLLIGVIIGIFLCGVWSFGSWTGIKILHGTKAGLGINQLEQRVEALEKR